MDDDPANRFPTARDLHDALEHFLDGDRDLEARRGLAAEHARRAEAALAGGSRADAGREIGRALGLDPQNAGALRMLMRLLTEMPDPLPAAAQAEFDRRWRERRTRTLRISLPLCLSPLSRPQRRPRWSTSSSLASSPMTSDCSTSTSNRGRTSISKCCSPRRNSFA